MHKRIIITGPAASGKDYLRKKYADKGYNIDVSYTSRKPRPGEVNGVDYWFVDRQYFNDGGMYEKVNFNNEWYGTSLDSWHGSHVFIMTPEGVAQISEEARKSCFVIYLNIQFYHRLPRLRLRDISEAEIRRRLQSDDKEFKLFEDYDLMITNPNF